MGSLADPEGGAMGHSAVHVERNYPEKLYPTFETSTLSKVQPLRSRQSIYQNILGATAIGFLNAMYTTSTAQQRNSTWKPLLVFIVTHELQMQFTQIKGGNESSRPLGPSFIKHSGPPETSENHVD